MSPMRQRTRHVHMHVFPGDRPVRSGRPPCARGGPHRHRQHLSSRLARLLEVDRCSPGLGGEVDRSLHAVRLRSGRRSARGGPEARSQARRRARSTPAATARPRRSEPGGVDCGGRRRTSDSSPPSTACSSSTGIWCPSRWATSAAGSTAARRAEIGGLEAALRAQPSRWPTAPRLRRRSPDRRPAHASRPR